MADDFDRDDKNSKSDDDFSDLTVSSEEDSVQPNSGDIIKPDTDQNTDDRSDSDDSSDPVDESKDDGSDSSSEEVEEAVSEEKTGGSDDEPDEAPLVVTSYRNRCSKWGFIRLIV